MNTNDPVHTLHILLLEDRPPDAELALRELRREGLEFTARRVVTEADYRAGLHDPELGLILADYALPSYDGLSALALARKERPEVPFLFVSGQLGEETAIEALHQGATDYVVKQRLSRLGPAVRRALREVEELRRTEQAETRFRTVFEQSPLGIAIIDPETAHFIDFNETAHRLLGYDRAEFARLNLFDIEAMETPEEVRQHLGTMLREGSADFETRHRTKTGEIRDVQVRTQVIQLAGRAVINAIWRDVTERKRAEAKLRESEARLNLALTASGMGVWEWNIPTGWVFWSDRCFAIAGTQRKEQTLDMFMELVHPDDAPRLSVELQDAVSSHTIFETQFRIIRPDGEMRWVSNLGWTEYDEAGKPLRMIGTVQDVTERKQAEARLRESEERLNLALTASGMGVWDWDIPTGRVYWSDQCYVIAGAPPGERTIDMFRELIHPDDAQRVSAKLEAVLSGGGDFDVQFRGTRPDGEVRWVSNFGRTEYDEAGKPLRMIGTVQDITDRKMAERAVVESAERLKELTRRLLNVQEVERRHLARELHDEIGQALTAVKVNLIRMERKPAEAADRIAESVAIVDRTLQRVRGMALDLRPSMLDDLGLVAALRWYVKQHAQRTDLASSFTVEPDTLKAEPDIETACFRAAQEALTNVTRHAQASVVCVTLREKAGVLELVVRDDGVGFNPVAALAGASRGMSMGLVGMRERVELCGGRIEIHSAPGEGTEVRITFPARVVPPGAPGDPP